MSLSSARSETEFSRAHRVALQLSPSLLPLPPSPLSPAMARSQPPQKAKPSAPKPAGKPKGGKPAKAAAAAPSPAAPAAKESAATVDSLRQEIIDLGGDDADYAMLQNVDGDDDEDVLGGGDDEVVDVSVGSVELVRGELRKLRRES